MPGVLLRLRSPTRFRPARRPTPPMGVAPKAVSVTSSLTGGGTGSSSVSTGRAASSTVTGGGTLTAATAAGRFAASMLTGGGQPRAHLKPPHICLPSFVVLDAHTTTVVPDPHTTSVELTCE